MIVIRQTKNIYRHRILFSLLAVTATCISLYAKKPEIHADKFESEGNKHIAIGNAILTSDEFEIKADKLTYDTENNAVSATGNVQGMFPTGRVVSKTATYNILNKSISAEHFRLGFEPLFIKGDSLQGTLKQFTAENATIYYNEPSFMGINATAKTLTFTEPESITLEGAVFKIGQLPVFYTPYYKQDGMNSPMNISTHAGYRNDLGVFVHDSIFFPQVNENIQPGAEIGYYSQRGVLAGPALRYKLDNGTASTNGELHSGFISDHGNRGIDVRGKAIDKKRHYIEWRNKGRINDNTTITGKLSLWSDSEAVRDFKPKMWRDNQDPDSFLEGVYTGKNFFISAFTRVAPNEWQEIQTRAPELRLDVMPIKFQDTNTWFDMHTSLANLYEKDPNGLIAEKKSTRADMYFGLRSPIKPGMAAVITPVIGSRITHYEKTLGNTGDYTRALGQIGFDAHLTANRIWDYDNETWDINGLRHTIRPTMQYRYIPEAQRGSSSIPDIDRRFFSTLLPSIDLADIRDVDEMHELNVFRFGAENSLQTKDPEYGSRDLANLNIMQDYNFSDRPGANDFSDLHTELSISPLHWLGFDLYNRFDPEHLTSEEFRTRTRLTNGDVWELYLSTDNLQNSMDQYYLDYQLRLTERYYFIPRIRFDTKRDKIAEQVYGLRTYIGNTWEVEYAISFTSGATREDGAGFSIRLNVGSF